METQIQTRQPLPNILMAISHKYDSIIERLDTLEKHIKNLQITDTQRLHIEVVKFLSKRTENDIRKVIRPINEKRKNYFFGKDVKTLML